MSVGKYSPTVTAAYMRDQEWHRRLQADDWHDDEGYDSYGYHKATEKDRAGYTEWDYLTDGQWIDNVYTYPLYEDIGSVWGFDGVRPVQRK
jgi:hypothetical protein